MDNDNQKQLSPKITITIAFDQATGAVSVNAPLEYKIVCYGMLEAAKKIIADFNPGAAVGGQIVIPSRREPA